MLFLRWIINALALLAVANLVPGFHVESFWTALIVALVLGLFNITIRPILLLLTLPINIVTLGVFTFILNSLMLLLASNIVKNFTIDNFWTALVGAVVLWFISLLTNLVLENREE